MFTHTSDGFEMFSFYMLNAVIERGLEEQFLQFSIIFLWLLTFPHPFNLPVGTSISHCQCFFFVIKISLLSVSPLNFIIFSAFQRFEFNFHLSTTRIRMKRFFWGGKLMKFKSCVIAFNLLFLMNFSCARWTVFSVIISITFNLKNLRVSGSV